MPEFPHPCLVRSRNTRYSNGRMRPDTWSTAEILAWFPPYVKVQHYRIKSSGERINDEIETVYEDQIFHSRGWPHKRFNLGDL